MWFDLLGRNLHKIYSSLWDLWCSPILILSDTQKTGGKGQEMHLQFQAVAQDDLR